MKRAELKAALAELKLSQSELARMMSINLRTVRRWIGEKDAISGPASCAIEAWIKLKRCGLGFGPCVIDITFAGELTPEMVRRRIRPLEAA